MRRLAPKDTPRASTGGSLALERLGGLPLYDAQMHRLEGGAPEFNMRGDVGRGVQPLEFSLKR